MTSLPSPAFYDDEAVFITYWGRVANARPIREVIRQHPTIEGDVAALQQAGFVLDGLRAAGATRAVWR